MMNSNTSCGDIFPSATDRQSSKDVKCEITWACLRIVMAMSGRSNFPMLIFSRRADGLTGVVHGMHQLCYYGPKTLKRNKKWR